VNAMRVRFLTALAVLVAAGGCSSGTAPGVESLSFTAVLTRDPAAPRDASYPPTVRGREGRVEVLGVITTSNPCQEVTGRVSRTGRNVRLTVTARSLPVFCFAVVATFAYTAVIDGLAPAVYAVEVFHAYENTESEPARVFVGAVSVR
jgi:hypothetical protein